jgi:ubiquinone/menaquinone biosynthesis C-methylase UbiE
MKDIKHMQKKSDDTASWYESNVHKYFDECEIGAVLNVLRRIVPEKSKNLTVLDIGCGTGRFFNDLRETFDADVFGIDYSINRAEIAMKKSKTVVVADGRYLPFKDNTFDVCLSVEVIQHIPGRKDRIRYLTELKRVLKSEGRFILATINDNWWKRVLKRSILKRNVLNDIGTTYYYSLKELCDDVLEAGLKIRIKSGYLFFGHYEYNTKSLRFRFKRELMKIDWTLSYLLSNLPDFLLLGGFKSHEESEKK